MAEHGEENTIDMVVAEQGSRNVAPAVKTVRMTVPASTKAGELITPIDVVSFVEGIVTAVEYVSVANITGTATNYRTIGVVNKGKAGSGSTVLGSLAFKESSIKTEANIPKVLTLNATATNLEIKQGEVLVFSSTVTGEGLIDPGGEIIVKYRRNTKLNPGGIESGTGFVGIGD